MERLLKPIFHLYMGAMVALSVWLVTSLVAGQKTVYSHIGSFQPLIEKLEVYKHNYGEYPRTIASLSIVLTPEQRQVFKGYAGLGNDYEINLQYKKPLFFLSELNCKRRSNSPWQC